MAAVVLPPNVLKLTFGFIHPKRATGMTENFYINYVPPLTQAALDTAITTLSDARVALMAPDSSIAFARVKLPVGVRKRIVYRKQLLKVGTFGPTTNVTLMPEVAALCRCMDNSNAPTFGVWSNHYVGCVPSNVLTDDGQEVKIKNDLGALTAWGIALDAYAVALNTTCTQVYKAAGGGYAKAAFSAFSYVTLRSRDRGRPLDLWHGIHAA